MSSSKPFRTSRRRFLKTSASAALTLAAIPSSYAVSGSGDGSPRRLPPDFLDAVCGGRVDDVRRMLTDDPSLIELTDEAGRSAFALAHLNGRSETAAVLVEAGYASDLHESALAGDWERFSLLSDSKPDLVNRNHPVGGTAMFAAATGGAGFDMWRVYAAAGRPNVVPRAERGVTPLQAALGFRDLFTAEMTAASILSNDGHPDPPDNALPPPLHMAAGRGSEVMVEMLIHWGADVNRRDEKGLQAHMFAERGGHSRVVQLLSEHQVIPRLHNSNRSSVDVNGEAYIAPDLSRHPVLDRVRFVGASHRDPETVRNVVSRSPEFAHAVATTGERAVEAGAHMGNREIVDLLLDYGAPYSLPTAVMRGDTGAVRTMLNDDPLRVNERGAHGFALLWYPVIGGGNLDLMELLLNRGAEVERQHFLGTTALHWASRGDSTDMVAMLLNRGADPLRVGYKFGGRPMTPLQIARSAGNTKIVELLESKATN